MSDPVCGDSVRKPPSDPDRLEALPLRVPQAGRGEGSRRFLAASSAAKNRGRRGAAHWRVLRFPALRVFLERGRSLAGIR